MAVERRADPETAYRFANLAGFGDHAAAYAAYTVGLPAFSGGTPMNWSMRDVRRLLFLRWRAERGDYDGDLFGLPPKPMPPIVRRVVEADHRNREGYWP